MSVFSENTVELAALDYFAQLGYQTLRGPNIAPGEPASERNSYEEVILWGRLREAIERINVGAPGAIVDEAIKQLRRAESQSPIDENYRLHTLLTEGVPVEYRETDGTLRTTRVWLVDFEHPTNNDWIAVNQFTIVENGKNRRPDVLVLLNGLPLALLELKNPAAGHATLKSAWHQVQTYRHEIPSVFVPNAVTVISDGTSAAMSSYAGAFEHYAPWKTIEGREVVSNLPALEVLIKGVFDQRRFLDLLQNFIVFSDETATDTATGQPTRVLVKRVSKYHQYWAVNAAVESTVEASRTDGDRRGGVVWHTQGSGKSLEMVFYAAKIMRDPRMANPTLVFITDRNDLDDQLFGETFAPARILPETPVQAATRVDLRAKLKRASGGIVFTTLQKFAPGEDGDTNAVLTERRNVVVVADEAHRSQYGFGEYLDRQGRLKAGLAKHMRDALPGATYLGFTGTPIESNDKSTRSVFGDYIDIYDLTRAVEDGATVKIFYESRLAKVDLSAEDYAALDELADEITEQVEDDAAMAAKSRWSRLEAIVGADSRLDVIAADIVEHWERRRDALFGKAMIVVMSRRIAVNLYEKIVALRPEWHSDDPVGGKIKVVMTGSAADPSEFQPHIHSKDVRRQLKLRAKNPDNPLELVIVRDMWLTGFDAPSMHTMYVDKTMHGAGLMQAIARVNRTFRDKPGGLVVDYIGVFAKLQAALAEYSPSDRDQAGVPIDEMVSVMLEKHDIVGGLLHGVSYDSSPALSASQRLAEYARVLDFVMADPDRTARFNDQVLALAKAFALAGARDEAVAIRNDVRLFTDVRAAILKIQNPDSGRGGSGAVEIDTALGQLLNEAVAADQVLDLYKLAGVEAPELSILSDEFLDSLVQKDKPNLQLGLLRRLLNDQIRTVQRTNIVQGRKFSELLDEAINRYTNRSLTTAEIIAELVTLAKQIRDEARRTERLGLSAAEVALYDAIAQNDAAVVRMGDETLKKIAVDLVWAVRSSLVIDWDQKESVRASMRSKVRRLLAKYDYPPDAEAKAIDLVLEQAELVAASTDEEDDGGALVTVWFGTNRRPLDRDDPAGGFGNEIDTEHLYYGTCALNIPRSHEFGSVGRRWWSVWKRLGNRDEPIRLKSTVVFANEGEFAAALRQVLDDEDTDNRVLVYLHGYRTSFADAAIRAGQIAYDLKVTGPMAFYSWPSQRRVGAYFADEDRVAASENQFVEFLRCLTMNTGVERVDLLIHSMGNRLFGRSVEKMLLDATTEGVRLGTVVLAAPDIEVDLFKQIAKDFPSAADKTTMYVSSKDLPLRLSTNVHTTSRAGFAPPVTVVDGIDTIEVTDVDFSRLGHGYYSEASEVLHDIKSLLEGQHDPSARLRLKALQNDSGQWYWRFGR